MCRGVLVTIGEGRGDSCIAVANPSSLSSDLIATQEKYVKQTWQKKKL